MPNRMNHRDGPRIALIADAEILDEWSAMGKLRFARDAVRLQNI
jgi:hypothetical protein